MALTCGTIECVTAPTVEHTFLEREEPFSSESNGLAELRYNVKKDMDIMFYPPTVGSGFEVSAALSMAELRYIADSLSDLIEGRYACSRPDESIDEFLAELKG